MLARFNFLCRIFGHNYHRYWTGPNPYFYCRRCKKLDYTSKAVEYGDYLDNTTIFRQLTYLIKIGWPILLVCMLLFIF